MTSAGGGGSDGNSSDGNDVVFSLGIVADIQHSSTDVLLRDEHERTKYWDTLTRLTAARRDWQSRGVDGLAQLGDLIDGNTNEAASVEDCARVMSALFDSVAPPANDDDGDDSGDGTDDDALPFLHVVGNHCLRHLSRRALRRVHRSAGVWEDAGASEGGGGGGGTTTRFRGVGGPTAHRAYYARTFARLPDVVFVVLDTTEMSLMERDTEGGWADGDYGHVEATRYLAERPLGSSIEMEEYNGGVTPAQLGFLRETLQACVDGGKRAVVLAHHPMLPTWECGEGATIEPIMDPHLCWNHAAVRQVLTEHREKGTGVPVCRAVLTGHCHWGGNGVADGIAFVTMKSMMFNPNGSAYGVLEFTRGGGIRLDGCGTLQDDVVISAP